MACGNFMLDRYLGLLLVAAALWPMAPAQAGDPGALSATLSTVRRYVLPGQPIWVDFTVTNTSDEPVELVVAGSKALPSVGLVGLPPSHVFSGPAFAGLTITAGAMGRTWDVAQSYQPPAAAETLLLGPHASVGVGLEVTQYYPVLRTPGRFRLSWSPYGGTVTSNELIIEVATPKQVLIQTDQGSMTIRLFYDEAPNHIENFIELVRQGFYDNLLFHRIVPGYYIQTGCPNGDGTGVRPDGRKLAAEFSTLPVDRGTVLMARLEDNPDSASSQFLICTTRVSQWDGKYTVFGELVGPESLETLDRLMTEPTDAEGRPLTKLYLRSARVTDAPPSRSPAMPQTP